MMQTIETQLVSFRDMNVCQKLICKRPPHYFTANLYNAKLMTGYDHAWQKTAGIL